MSSSKFARKVILQALVLFFSLLQAAPAFGRYVKITAANYKRISRQKPVLVKLNLSCSMGSYATMMFRQALSDLRGVDISSYNVNKAYPLASGKSYDLGTILLIKNGKAIASSHEDSEVFYMPKGYNNIRRWVYNALKREGIRFQMSKPGKDFLNPQKDFGGSVDLKKGLIAHYDFQTAKDLTGISKDFNIGGKVRIAGGLYQSNGKYIDNNGGFLVTKDILPFNDGLTIALKFRLNSSDKPRRSLFTIGSRKFDVAMFENRLTISPQVSYYTKPRPRTMKDMEFSNDFYVYPGVHLENKRWYHIIFSTDIRSGRLYTMLDGKRLKDIQLSRRLIKFWKKRNNNRIAFQFHNWGYGGVFNGQADDLVVYNRAMNSKELSALYRKFNSSKKKVKKKKYLVPPPPNPQLKRRFMEAASKGNTVKVKQYLRRGVSVDAIHGGWTALMLASFYGHVGTVKVLIKNRADISIKYSGWDALKLAKHRKKTRVVTMLEDYHNRPRFYFERQLNAPRTRSLMPPPDLKAH